MKLQVEKNSNKTDAEKMNALCGYRKFKLFIPGEDAVQFLIKNSETFHLKGKYDVWNNKHYELPLQGYYGDEYKLRVSARQIKNLGVGIEILGDFKDFYNNGYNEDLFSWGEFIASTKKLMSLFPSTAQQVHVINIEPRLELQIPDEWHIAPSRLIANILRFKGKYSYRNDDDRDEKAYHLQFGLSEYMFNIATYSNKENEGAEAKRRISVGMEIKKSSYLKDRGITFLSDLTKYSNHHLLLKQAAELFSHLIIYQEEVDNELLLNEEGIYCRDYNRKAAWNKLHNESPEKYKYMKSKLETVIDRVCPISYKKEMQKMLIEKINEVVAKVALEGVPDFPLYMEKQEMPCSTTIPFAA